MTSGTLENMNVPFMLPFIKDLKKNWGWFLTLGILMIFSGLLAVSLPFMTAVTVELLAGWLLIFGGLFQMIHAVKSRKRKGFIASLLIGILTLVVGVWLISYPLSGVLTFTLFLGVFFFIEGVVKFVESFQLRPQEGWAWLLFTGIIECLFGILVWSKWPTSAAWLIGVLIGVDFIFSGWSMVALSLFSRKLKAVKAPSEEKKTA